jgi:hypothetical protein
LNRAIEERGIDPFEYTSGTRRQHPVYEPVDEAVNSSGLEELLQRYNQNNGDSGKGNEEMGSGELSVLLKETLSRSDSNNKRAPGLPRFFDDIVKINTATRQQQLQGVESSPSPPTTSSSNNSPPTSVQA